MARLRRSSFGIYTDADCSTLDAQDPAQNTWNTPSKTRASPRKKSTKKYQEPNASDDESVFDAPKLVMKTPTSAAKQQRKQIRLAPLNAASTHNTPLKLGLPMEEKRRVRRASSPLKAQIASRLAEASNAQDMSSDSEYAIDDSDSASSESDEELPSPSKLIKRRSSKGFKKPRSKFSNLDLSKVFKRLSIFNNGETTDVPPVPALPPAFDLPRPTSSSEDKENDGNDHMLHFSPPRLSSPGKKSTRDVTPPTGSPSKGKLFSPSKKTSRIPQPPQKPNTDDTFWDPEKVNEWNDQHSPRKEWKSPAKLQQLRTDASTSPTSSPRKLQSPSKRTKADIEAKKTWEASKYQLAESFLLELDQVLTSGQIGDLTASTGGVRFIWSKNLTSTAGRANWKRQTTKTRQLDGSTTTISTHNASIELAEKVIDSSDRLLNVIAHEFCHLANYMISGIKDQPHGRQFKLWGAKASLAFAHRGVEVTTKHSYAIEYKYIWHCSDGACGSEFKRHSKSIDTGKQRCGKCKGKLVQVKPVPRKEAATTGYAGFVKEHFAVVKRGLPAGSSQKEVMLAVAQKYREMKKASPEGSVVGDEQSVVSSQGSSSADLVVADGEVDDVAKMFDNVVTIED